MTKQNWALQLSVLAVSLLLAGCTADDVKSKVADYNDSVQKTTEVLNVFYSGLNDFSRQAYISHLMFHPMEKMYTRAKIANGIVVTNQLSASGTAKERTYPTGIPYRFSPDGVRVRILIVKALAGYSQGLAALASSDAPEKVSDEIQSLGDSLIKLGSDAAALSKRSSDAQEIAAIGGPLTKFAALIGQAWMEHKKIQDIRDSVRETNQLSAQLFDLLEGDVTALSAGLYGNETDTMIKDYIRGYNQSYCCKTPLPSNNDRLNYLKQIDQIIAMQNSIQSSDPVALIQDMRKLHDELVIAVDRKLKASDAEQIGSDVETFKEDAQRSYVRSVQAKILTEETN
jgi:hypothetical protein